MEREEPNPISVWKTLMRCLNRKIRYFSLFIYLFIFLIFVEKNREKHVQWKEKERERVKFSHCKLKEKERVQISCQAISSITCIRIIKKCVFDYFFSTKGLKIILALTHFFIKESENKQEDYGMELIKAVKSKKHEICATIGNFKSLSLK